jgi:hypothetical protein
MHMMRHAAAAATISLLAATAASAQPQVAHAAAAEPTQPGVTRPAPKPVAKAAPSHRWYEAQTIQLDARYRLIDTSAGVRSSNHLQHRQTFRGAFKFDPKGRYTLQAGAGSGTGFIGSWENAGPGTGDGDVNVGVRYLYVSAAPMKGLEFQAGGLGLVRGESTEITSYDNDGYIVGERVTVKQPARFFFDEISVSAGYLGDTSTPSVFERFDRFDEHNYTQALVGKKLGARAAVSVDWTGVGGVDTWRQAIRLNTKETGVIDAVRLELYERTTGTRDEGFAVTAERLLPHKLSLAGGYATVDRNYGGLNADRFNRGNRVFVDAKLPLVHDLSLNVFYGRAVGTDYAVANKHRFDVVVGYNALKALQRAGAL